MKNRSVFKKKGLAILLSSLLFFGSLSFGAEIRSFAEGGEQTSAENDTETTPLVAQKITFEIPDDLVYTGEDLSKSIIAKADSGKPTTRTFYSGTSASGTPVETVINAGDYTVVAKVDADETHDSAEETEHFKISAATITEDMVADISDETYTGSAIKPAVKVTFNGKTTLKEDTDYTVSYNDNVDVTDKAEVTIKGKGNFEGTSSSKAVTKYFKINPATITEEMIDDIPDETYKASAIEPSVRITFNGKTTLKEDTDYTVSYKSNVDVTDKAEVIIAGKGNFSSSSVSKYFKIKPATIEDDWIEDIPVQLYTGSEITPDPKVIFHDTIILTEGTDYTIEYRNNINISEVAVARVRGTGNFNGSGTKFFAIRSAAKKTPVFSSGFRDDVTVTYGEGFSGKTATLSEGDGTITYESSEPSVASVSETTGLVTVRNCGSTVITAKVPETDDYSAAEASYTLTVEKAKIYVTAEDKTVRQYETGALPVYPVLGEDYTVTGLIGDDSLRGAGEISYQKDGSNVDTADLEPGTYDIVLSGFRTPSDNYDIVYIDGFLTVQRSSGTTGGNGTPVIYGESETWGWDNVVSEIRTLIEENPVDELDGVTHVAAEIDMNGSTVVVKELIDAIRGEAIVVSLLYDNGTVWTIDGRDVDLYDKAKDVDLGVSIGYNPGSYIPGSALNQIRPSDDDYVYVSLNNYNGSFGFEATLSVNVAKALGESVTSRSRSRRYGMVANLYHFNNATQKFEFSDSGYIDESGSADFKMSHASDYVIVVDEAKLGGTADVMRVYNPNSGRHHFTANRDEIDFLTDLGWRYEGIAFTASAYGDDSLAVYRLYNPYNSEHLFTLSVNEKDFLISLGWIDEGIAWYSDSKKSEPVFRFYNPNAGDHHFTMNQNEVSRLAVAGWKNEGIAFYGVKEK